MPSPADHEPAVGSGTEVGRGRNKIRASYSLITIISSIIATIQDEDL